MKTFVLNPKNAKLIVNSGVRTLILKQRSGSYRVLIPHFILVKKENLEIKLLLCDTASKFKIKAFDSICYRISSIITNPINGVLYKKSLILKGLGLRASLENPSFLTLKLGYSHLVNVSIPDQIRVSINGNILTFDSYSKQDLGNFTSHIRSLKLPDCYKGKGFWHKYETKMLKEIKKK